MYPVQCMYVALVMDFCAGAVGRGVDTRNAACGSRPASSATSFELALDITARRRGSLYIDRKQPAAPKQSGEAPRLRLLIENAC